MRIIIDGMSLPENDNTHIIVYADGTAIKFETEEVIPGAVNIVEPSIEAAIAREENDG